MCFGRPVISARHAGRTELARQDRDDVLDVALPVEPALVQHRRDGLVSRGLQRAQAQILELPLQLPDAQPVGQRREEIEHLARGVLSRFGQFRASGHQEAQRRRPLRELDQHDADVLDHREQHLAQPLGLRGPLGRITLRRRGPDLVHPGDAGDERGDVVAEARDDLVRNERIGSREAREQRGPDRAGIELETGEDHRRPHGAVDQRLAVAAGRGAALLARVGQHRLERFAVLVGIDAAQRVEPRRDGLRRAGFLRGVQNGYHRRIIALGGPAFPRKPLA